MGSEKAETDKITAMIQHTANTLNHQAIFRLEHEFRSLINANFSYTSDSQDEYALIVPVAQPVTHFDIVLNALPPEIVNNLHDIAKRMAASGFSNECSHAYIASRREFLDESMMRLGLKKLTIDDTHRLSWDVLEAEIEKWIKGVNLCVKVLFPCERRLCDRVFFGMPVSADLAFFEVCRGLAIRLLSFANAVATGSRAPERLFRVLDVFETMRGLITEFEAVFLRIEAVTILKRLRDAVKGFFMELENLIRSDPAKAVMPYGGLHPITRYVMNYLLAAYRSRLVLEHVFDEDLSSLLVQMTWIMEVLQSNLEDKSKVYRDIALCSVFMMNNGRYIVQKVKHSELGSVLGDNWIRKHAAKIKQYHVNYQRSSWNKVVEVLKTDSGSLSSNGGFELMKEKLKLFNTQFEEICKVQSTWIIHDEQLKEELKIVVSGNLLPAYRSFIGKFQNASDTRKNVDKYIEYGVEDVEARINLLFEGSSGKK